jgi:hypothetical protein
MKKLTFHIVVVSFIGWLSLGLAHGADVDMGGVMDFIATSARDARGGSSITLDAKLKGSLYLPIRKLVSSDKKIEYAHAGAGANIYQEGHACKGEPVIVLLGNAPASAHYLTKRWAWYQTHVAETSLPDIFIGPLIRAPLPGIKWTWKSAVGGMVSIGFGGNKKKESE